MDDPDTFGSTLYSYSTAQAISDEWLDDYRVVAIGVTNKEARAHLQKSAASGTTAATAHPSPHRTGGTAR
jgi:predicted helicase